MLYRKDGETALVLKCEDDDELLYILRKLERSRLKWLRGFASELIEDFFAKTNGVEALPEVRVIKSAS